MSAERRIKALKVRVRSLQTSFSLIKTFMEKYNPDTDVHQVPVRLEHLSTLWTEYNISQAELESLDEAGIDDQFKARAEFESSYYKVKGFLLAENKTPVVPCSPSSHSAAHVPQSASHVRLPDVKLPVFNGNIDNWLNFHDLYISLVHSSADLSNIQKFYYLRSSLAGDALKLIQTIQISANNYMVAWKLLEDHYQNPLRLKQTYVDALFEFSTIKRESAAELHSLVEKFESNVKVLQQLGEQTQCWDLLLVRMLSTRLDPTTRRDWEEYASTQNVVSFQALTAFIQRRVNVLQTIQTKTIEQPTVNAVKRPATRPVSSHGATQFNPRKCLLCSDHHPLYMCSSFSNLSVEDKEKEVRRHQLCRNCLRKGHLAKECSSSSTCRKCRSRHHTQLCPSDGSSSGKPRSELPTINPSPSPSTDQQSTPTVSASAIDPTSYASGGKGSKSVLLATAVVILVDDNGVQHAARALLDSGSERCFISETLSQSLTVRRKKISLPIAGIGRSSTQARQKLVSTIRSRTSDYVATVEFLVLPRLTIDLPSTSIDTTAWKIPPRLQLADPAFHQANPVDIILGAEVFFDIFKPSGKIQLGESLPVLVNSNFGWLIAGRLAHCHPIAPVVSNVATMSNLPEMMERFWSLEEDETTPCYSVEEAACERHFQQTVSRNSEGRYIVRLPLKKDILANLSDNRNTAIRRFHLLERRLAHNEDLSKQYCEFMDEYHNLGHMERVQNYERAAVPCFHLPHHAVVREGSSTTKVRVVFDASCKSATGPSLNDALMVGPIVQEDMRSIMMRSRKHPVMLTADVKQMYRQILMDKRDTPLQLIVWRPSADSPLETFELKTVTYGTASAPFLATRVLKQLAEDERDNFPEAAEVLCKDFYVVDLFSGGPSVAETIKLREQLDSLLAKGGFQLRKWASNEEAVLEGVPPENRALQPSVDLQRDQSIKTLGVHWEPATDVFRYRIELTPPSTISSLTKRIALSLIAQLFDPLGLVGPVVTTAKMYMQSLWAMKDENGNTWGWDVELPPAMKERWTSYHSQLPLLNEVKIQRHILCSNPISLQLHFFSDASQHAYGACAYVRSTNAENTIKVALLTTKSKVAPLKQQSIPRLELCGALIATQLYQKVTSSLQLEAKTFFWVDSTTVISWLQSSPSTWTTFVANRVSKIQLATENCTWHHIAGQENPADHISRGMTAESILHNDLWWYGPPWLRRNEQEWPTHLIDPAEDAEVSREARKTPAVLTTVVTESSFIDQLTMKFSSYHQMLRVVAYCRRFASKRVEERQPDGIQITAEEMKETEAILIRLVQQQHFGEEWKLLQQAKPVGKNSKIKWFYPFLSADGMIRIGGRLKQAHQPYDAKHQIILPSSHPLSALLVQSYHEQHLHAAPQLLLTVLRIRYWILGARSLARRIVHKCVVCVRARPKLLEQFMAELPAPRITASRPFSSTGVDYWGPIYLQPTHRRAASKKAYVAVFVCFCTKAVHLELVGDLSTAKFIQALRRFVARRGLCSNMYSDNGTNFIGAERELRALVKSKNYQQTIAQECTELGIKWHFNPPKASHFGGLWEAAIKSAQKHFIRVLGTRTLAYDEMETLLTQIEACLNSRPLVPLSDDPSNFDPLTPGHFLVGSALKAVPDSDLTEVPFNRLRQYEATQKILQCIWQRWHAEYLSTLQARTKWCNPPVQIAKNQLVVIKDEKLPPMRWPTARILDLHPGVDGITVQTPQGKFTRPVSKLCLLPIAPMNETTAAENSLATAPETNCNSAEQEAENLQ